jgi:hypothetical protein
VHIPSINRLKYIMMASNSVIDSLIDKFKPCIDFEECFSLVQKTNDCRLLYVIPKVNEAEFEKIFYFFLDNQTIKGAEQILRLSSEKISFGIFANLFKKIETDTESPLENNSIMMEELIKIIVAFKHKIINYNIQMINTLITNDYYKYLMIKALRIHPNPDMESSKQVNTSIDFNTLYYKETNFREALFNVMKNNTDIAITKNDILEYRRYLKNNVHSLNKNGDRIVFFENEPDEFIAYSDELYKTCDFFKNPPQKVSIKIVSAVKKIKLY